MNMGTTAAKSLKLSLIAGALLACLALPGYAGAANLPAQNGHAAKQLSTTHKHKHHHHKHHHKKGLTAQNKKHHAQ